MPARSYGQFCGLTRAVELVGERWAMLIVRDLLVGPRRFTDLLRGLPRIPTNILTTRLKELQAGGVIRRVPLGGRGVNSKDGAEAGLLRFCAGEGHDGAVLTSRLVVGVHRVDKEHLVENGEAPRVAGAHAEEHKVLVLGARVGDLDLLAL